MKPKQLKQMNKLEFEGKLLELRKELMKMQSQVAVGTVPKQSTKIKQLKRTVAQILTVQNQIKTQGGSKKE